MTPETRALWLEERRKSLGASDVAQVLGVSPYGGAWNVWASKKLGFEAAESLPMRVGTYLEPLVADLVQERWGEAAALEEVGAGACWAPNGQPEGYARAVDLGILRPPRDKWAHASPDRLVLRPGHDLPGVLQIKTSGTGEGWGPDGAEATADTVPPQYLVQTMWEMWVVSAYFAPYIPIPGTPFGWLAVLISNRDLRIYPVRWDAERMAGIIATCKAWWERHIVGGEAPPIDGTRACTEALAWLQSTARPGRIELPEAAGDAVEQYAAWLARRDEADRNARLARNRLFSMLGESAKGLCWAGGRRKQVSRSGDRLTVRSVAASAAATTGEVNFDDAIPLGAFGGDDE